MEYTDIKVLGSLEGIKLVFIDDNVIGTKLENVGGITLGHDFVTDLGSLDGLFDGFNDGKLE